MCVVLFIHITHRLCLLSSADTSHITNQANVQIPLWRLPSCKFASLENLLESNDESLFTATLHNPQRVLHHQLLPPAKQTPFKRSRVNFTRRKIRIPSKNILTGCMLCSDMYRTRECAIVLVYWWDSVLGYFMLSVLCAISMYLSFCMLWTRHSHIQLLVVSVQGCIIQSFY